MLDFFVTVFYLLFLDAMVVNNQLQYKSLVRVVGIAPTYNTL